MADTTPDVPIAMSEPAQQRQDSIESALAAAEPAPLHVCTPTVEAPTTAEQETTVPSPVDAPTQATADTPETVPDMNASTPLGAFVLVEGAAAPAAPTDIADRDPHAAALNEPVPIACPDIVAEPEHAQVAEDNAAEPVDVPDTDHVEEEAPPPEPFAFTPKDGEPVSAPTHDEAKASLVDIAELVQSLARRRARQRRCQRVIGSILVALLGWVLLSPLVFDATLHHHHHADGDSNVASFLRTTTMIFKPIAQFARGTGRCAVVAYFDTLDILKEHAPFECASSLIGAARTGSLWAIGYDERDLVGAKDRAFARKSLFAAGDDGDHDKDPGVAVLCSCVCPRGALLVSSCVQDTYLPEAADCACACKRQHAPVARVPCLSLNHGQEAAPFDISVLPMRGHSSDRDHGRTLLQDAIPVLSVLAGVCAGLVIAIVLH